MSQDAKLKAAVQVFTELGWQDAATPDVLGLPLGTAEQRRIARDGLARGDWNEFALIAPGRYGTVDLVGVNRDRLTIFAIRVGVAARRLAQILPWARSLPPQLIVQAVTSRGHKYAQDFVAAACVAGDRGLEHSATFNGWPAVLLVHHMQLPLPESVEYFKDWAVFAAYALTNDTSLLNRREVEVDISMIEARFLEHLRSAIHAGIPATGPINRVVGPALARDWCDRSEAVELVFAALDAAARPGDRKAWFSILVNELAVTNDEFLDRAEQLVQTMSLGDPFVIEKVAPLLIMRGDEHSLTEVLTVALLAKPKKTRRVVLLAAADRPRPADDVVAAIAHLVTELASGDDLSLSRAANRVMSAWNIESQSAPDPVDDVRGLWQPTPNLWMTPKFELDEPSTNSVRELGTKLLRRRADCVDVAVEKFLAQLVALAHQKPDAAKTALAGMQIAWQPGLKAATVWASNSTSELKSEPSNDESAISDDSTLAALLELQSEWSYTSDPIAARDEALTAALGEVPVLLSTPSWVDLRIDLADLVDRLEIYERAGASAIEADLLLALTRLDISTATESASKALQNTAVQVRQSDESLMGRSAGQIVADYITDPVEEPDLVIDTRLDGWDVAELTLPTSLADFPDRLTGRVAPVQYFAVFPTWRKVATRMLYWTSESERGLVLRQLARAPDRFDGPTAMNFLAELSHPHDAAAAHTNDALREAWERGLLQPGVADVRYLGWQRPLSGLAAFASTSVELAQEGLLSVVWPILDDLIVESMQAPRTLAGTIDLVRAMKGLLAEVNWAIETGRAQSAALDLPGLRELAERGGSGNAVRIAQEIVLGLPERGAVIVPSAAEPAVDIEQIWPVGAGTAPAVIDGVSIEAHWLDESAPRKRLVLDLRLPSDSGRVLRVDKSWFYDLEVEHQCAASVLGSETTKAEVWLHWDEKAEQLIAEEYRNWAGQSHGPLDRTSQVGPLTVTMVAVVLATLCHDDSTSHYYVESILRSGDVGSQSVQVALRMLLEYPDVSPARMVKMIEKHPDLLAVMWPVLTESIRVAAATAGSPPKWLNRVLDTAIYYAPQLREAMRLRRLPADSAQWVGLHELAARPGKSAALTKARVLRDELRR